MHTRNHLLILGLLAATLFFVNLGGYDLWPPDEPRFAQAAREMLKTGDYLVPRVNGLPYKEKPPLLFWFQAISAIPFGDVTEVPARLPSALGGGITVLLTYLLVGRLYDSRTAFLAALILATTQRFWWQTRFGQIDMLLTSCTTAAFLFFWLWHKERKDGYLIGFYLSIAAGVFAKGPPAVIFPLLMVLVFFWKRKDDRKRLHLFLGLAGVTLLIAAWLVPARMAVSVETSINASGSIASNLFRQTIGRFFLGVSHANPPWYYLLNLPVDLFPWSLFLPWTVLWVWRKKKQDEAMRFLLSWTVPAFLFFSICVGKRALYLLPLYPAFAALLARSIVELEEEKRARWLKSTRAVWGFCLLLVAAAPWVLLCTEYRNYWVNSLALLSLCALLCGVHALRPVWTGKKLSLAPHMAGHFALLLVWVAVAGFPLMNQHKSAKSFCAPLRHLSQAGARYDLYSLGFSREEYVYYAEHSHERVPSGLLHVEGTADLDPLQLAALQSGIMRAYQRAAEDVPVDSISSVSDEDVQRLRQALEDRGAMGLGGSGFREAVESFLRELLEVMEGDGPAFIITQERDWRWVLALCPDARELTILKDEPVGSREVLLVANATACGLVAQDVEAQAQHVGKGKE